MNLVENWFLWFLFYSIVGWVWEVIICSIPQKKFINRGFLNGPYCPIYGWGACLDVAILGGIQQWWLIFILSVLLTGVLEYATSYVMENSSTRAGGITLTANSTSTAEFVCSEW